jgi:hypothetical protein
MNHTVVLLGMSNLFSPDENFVPVFGIFIFSAEYQGPLKSLFCRTIFSVFSTYEEEIKHC